MRKQTVTAKLISAFVFATPIVQFLFFLYPKFQASSLLQYLHIPVCVRHGRNPEARFSHVAAQIITFCSFQSSVHGPECPTATGMAGD